MVMELPQVTNVVMELPSHSSNHGKLAGSIHYHMNWLVTMDAYRPRTKAGSGWFGGN